MQRPGLSCKWWGGAETCAGQGKNISHYEIVKISLIDFTVVICKWVQNAILCWFRIYGYLCLHLLFLMGPINIIIPFLPALHRLPWQGLSVMPKYLNCRPGHLNQGVEKNIYLCYISQ